MKIAFHNFLTTLRRYKVSSLLNVIGLTLAFTAFYVILVQVRWEMTFNRAIPDAGQICLVAPRSPFDETAIRSVRHGPTANSSSPARPRSRPAAASAPGAMTSPSG